MKAEGPEHVKRSYDSGCLPCSTLENLGAGGPEDVELSSEASFVACRISEDLKVGGVERLSGAMGSAAVPIDILPVVDPAEYLKA